MINGPPGMTDDAFIQLLFDTNAKYDGLALYNLSPIRINGAVTTQTVTLADC